MSEYEWEQILVSLSMQMTIVQYWWKKLNEQLVIIDQERKLKS
jgi:hypothetical protein